MNKAVQDLESGIHRQVIWEALLKTEGKAQKRMCEEGTHGDTISIDEMAVVVKQHRQEQ